MQWTVAGIMPDTDRWVRDQMVVGYRSTLDLYGRRGMTLFFEILRNTSGPVRRVENEPLLDLCHVHTNVFQT